VPVNMVGSGVAVELITKIDQGLHRGDVDIVDGTKVQDNGAEERAGCDLFGCEGSAATRAWVIPWAVLERVVSERSILYWEVGNLRQLSPTCRAQFFGFR
jgi:hypothetical protein